RCSHPSPPRPPALRPAPASPHADGDEQRARRQAVPYWEIGRSPGPGGAGDLVLDAAQVLVP
ncbi:hypothetical protein ACGFSB_37385, partial [Streptomyces sp. NPDC048441]|uniref:hypothetical protein n=1 Tax=Streptomyces sp. NPDC048441 TaxID=3365552 RepID=UPI003719A8C6